jgi:hypothetical protein
VSLFSTGTFQAGHSTASASAPASDERTKEIQETVDSTRDEQQKKERAAAKSQQRMQQQMLADPTEFVIVNLAGTGTPGEPGRIIVSISRQGEGDLTDTKMQIVFSMGRQQPWVFNPQIPCVMELASTTMDNVPKLGDHAVVCFSAVDPRIGQRRRWRKTFVLVSTPLVMPSIPNMPRRPSNASQFAQLAFQADSEATLTPDSDAHASSNARNLIWGQKSRHLENEGRNVCKPPSRVPCGP